MVDPEKRREQIESKSLNDTLNKLASPIEKKGPGRGRWGPRKPAPVSTASDKDVKPETEQKVTFSESYVANVAKERLERALYSRLVEQGLLLIATNRGAKTGNDLRQCLPAAEEFADILMEYYADSN